MSVFFFRPGCRRDDLLPREIPPSDRYKAEYITGSHLLEAIWVAVPTVLLIVFLVGATRFIAT